MHSKVIIIIGALNMDIRLNSSCLISDYLLILLLKLKHGNLIVNFLNKLVIEVTLFHYVDSIIFIDLVNRIKDLFKLLILS